MTRRCSVEWFHVLYRHLQVSMSEITFNTDAMASIGRAVSLNMPMMMLIKEDDAISDKWLHDMIVKNGNVQDSTRQALIKDFITLQLTKGSTEFRNLISVMPMFQNAQTPCLFFIFKGQVLDYIPKDADAAEMESKLLKIRDSVNAANGTATDPQPAQTGTSASVLTNSASGQPSQYESQTPPQHYYSSSPTPMLTPTPTPTPTPQPQSESSDENERRKKNHVPDNQNKTLKEESNDLAAKIYQENLLKQRRQAKEDRQRILKLMELDRLEKKRANAKREKTEEVHENLHNPKLLNSTNYTIQLKLLDGTSIRRQFPGTSRLADVRAYILDKYPDYHSVRFYFFKAVERVTYGDADENRTLHDLNLNMTTLILKPIEHEPESVIATEYPTSKFSWLRNKMSTLIWGDDQPKPPTSADSFLSSTGSSNTEEESDNGSVYHTPVLTHTGSATNLKPVLSSFNLYGSLQSEGRSNDAQTSQAGEHQRRVVLREDSSNSQPEEMDFHNGNSISLQFPDEPK